MKYILYNLKSLKVEHIYNKPLTAKVCDNFYEINGIAEYKGEIPKGDYLKVDNVREEVEKWTEKELITKEIKKIVPKVVKTYEPIYDDNGEIINHRILENTIEQEVVEIVEEEVEIEKLKTHIVCDLVAHFYPKRELTEEQKAKREATARIKALKEELAKTDYQAIKYAEGWLSEEEYAPIKTQRQAYREEINRLEMLL